MTNADEGAARAANGAAQVGTTALGVGVAELTHHAVRGQLSEYLDGTLGDGDRWRIDRHLTGCRACSAYLATLRATVEALEQLPRPTAPTGARSKILEQARRETG